MITSDNQSSFADKTFQRDLTTYLMQTRTKKKIITDETLARLADNLHLLKWNKDVEPLLNFLQENKIINEKWVVKDDKKEIIIVLQEFKNNAQDVLDDEGYKKRYTQQMVIWVALLEGVPRKIIHQLYDNENIIDDEIQKVFQDNHVTMMDMTLNDVNFWEKEHRLYLYTMLFLHSGEKKKDALSNTESAYYKIDWENITIKDRWIKSFEQAFNSSWQMYNETYGDPTLKLPHHSIKTIEDILKLYTEKTSLQSWVVKTNKMWEKGFVWHTLDKESKTIVLNMTRALLHKQAHYKLDYTQWEHDPASFITYKKDTFYKNIYGDVLSRINDGIVKDFFEKEVKGLQLIDKVGNIVNERRLDNYDASNKTWSYPELNFNGVTNVSWSWRIKWLSNSIVKLTNDPKYNHHKRVTDIVANTLYTEDHTDTMRTRLGLMTQLPESLIKNARIDIKGEKSRELFLEQVAPNGSFDRVEAFKNLKKHGLDEERIKLLLKNKNFMDVVYYKATHPEAPTSNKNKKTSNSYEEFKLVTSSGTEWQCIQRGQDDIMSNNEQWSGHHGLYGVQKSIEGAMRPNNNSITYTKEKFDYIIENEMRKEEEYLFSRAVKLWIVSKRNKHKFDPWKAIYYQLLQQEKVKYGEKDYLTDSLDHSGKITTTKEAKYKAITNNTSNYFITKDDQFSHQKDVYYKNYKYGIIPSFYKQAVKERYHNILQKKYVGVLAKNREGKLSYIISKKDSHMRVLETMMKGKEIYNAKKSTQF